MRVYICYTCGHIQTLPSHLKHVFFIIGFAAQKPVSGLQNKKYGPFTKRHPFSSVDCRRSMTF